MCGVVGVRYLFIWIVLASQEDKVLQSVGQAVMVLRSPHSLQIHIFSLIVQICRDHHESQSSSVIPQLLWPNRSNH